MTKQELLDLVKELFDETPNLVHLPEEDVDVPAVEEPLVGFASADDPIWDEYKKPEAIGEEWMAPKEWMDEAKTVIAFFFPYTEDIRGRARKARELVNEAWGNGYPAGSRVAGAVTEKLIAKLEEKGIKVLNPAKDPRMSNRSVDVIEGGEEGIHFIPSWSTRHACYAAGLGTFGTHRHMITEKGACGTIQTLIIDLELEPTPREYTGIYDNCIKCGACVRRCPAKAITLENLRNLKKCRDWGGYLRENVGPGGCGKCMVAVPCEHQNPSRLVKKQG